METPDLTSGQFWHGAGNHIALAPGRAEDANGLLKFADAELGARGWCFFQTSGSEAGPKWVGLEKNAFLISAEAVNRHFDIAESDRWLIALPLHHVGGFSIFARSFISGSAVSYSSGKWDAHEFARQCNVERITVTSLVPTQVWDLVGARIPSPDSMRAVIVGGGALSRETRDCAMSLGWRVLLTYGMTETASQVAAQAPDGYGDVLENAMEVLPHWEVETDPSDLLAIRGPALAKGYAVRDGAGAWQWQPIDPSLGLRTRDRVKLWRHGTRRFLAFLGRDASFAKILGELVNIEQLQNRIEDIALALGIPSRLVIVPLPDERKESRLVLVSETGALTAEQAQKVLGEFHATCQPFERIDASMQVPHLPVSALGKIERSKLAAMLGQPSP